MIFKTYPIENEFDSEQVSPYLRACALTINRAYNKKFNKSLTVTSILRSPELQITYCVRYKIRSDFHHCSGFALDFRSTELSGEEIEFLEKWTQFNLNKMCKLAYHKKGTAPHLHLNMIDGFLDKAKIYAVVKNVSAENYFTG